MFFPIGDDQIVGGAKPIFSYGFIVLNILIFGLQLVSPGQLICEYAAIPDNILNGNAYFTLISSMFMHGGWMHLIGNMLFLWVFADNIEQVIGNINFLIFYFLGGLAGSLAHIYLSQGGLDVSQCCTPCHALNPCDIGHHVSACARYTPSLGASGAISAVLGAYLVMFPKSRIKILVLVIFRSFKIPAMLFLGVWFLQQLIPGVGSFTGSEGGGVAWWAHIGGFVFGVLIGLYARKAFDLGPVLEDQTFV